MNFCFIWFLCGTRASQYAEFFAMRNIWFCVYFSSPSVCVRKLLDTRMIENLHRRFSAKWASRASSGTALCAALLLGSCGWFPKRSFPCFAFDFLVREHIIQYVFKCSINKRVLEPQYRLHVVHHTAKGLSSRLFLALSVALASAHTVSDTLKRIVPCWSKNMNWDVFCSTFFERDSVRAGHVRTNVPLCCTASLLSSSADVGRQVILVYSSSKPESVFNYSMFDTVNILISL